MGMPLLETAEISGKTPPVHRKELWRNRHVFFCTPQTLMKDLSSGNLDGSAIVCLILDEAHKATGKYDYVSVIPLLEEAGARFRILGLSATPGTTI
jgi:ERCC4-related helicase